MKRISILATLLLASSLFFVTSAQAAPETYTLDNTHSYVMWHISHFGFSNPAGKWMADGTLTLDEANPQNSKINVTINVDSMDTGIPKLETHLKSAEFFDVTKFPTATFVSDKVIVTGKDTAKVQGMLTVHGVTKPLTLNVKLNKLAISPITNKKTAGFTATATLKRSDYGMSAFLPGLSDTVKLDIEAEATKTG